MNRIRRWGDNDRHFGPFTYARDRRYRPMAVVLSSAEEEYPGCNLRVSALGRTLIIELPTIIKPYREKVEAKSWDAATIERLGRDWYWNIDRRSYGFTYLEGHLSVLLGRQTDDSSTEQRWGKFLPWTQWRFVRHGFYGLQGEHIYDAPQGVRRKLGGDEWRAQWDAEQAREAAVPTAPFAFKDFDGESLTATTKIEEREWKFGTGYFKWLSLFRKPKIRRSLDIRFSGETGERKGSWKGGTVGHSIDMLPGELHEAAFKRYCTKHRMTFAGPMVPT